MVPTKRRRSNRVKKKTYKYEALTKRDENQEEEEDKCNSENKSPNNNLNLREELMLAEGDIGNILDTTPEALPGDVYDTPNISCGRSHGLCDKHLGESDKLICKFLNACYELWHKEDQKRSWQINEQEVTTFQERWVQTGVIRTRWLRTPVKICESSV